MSLSFKYINLFFLRAYVWGSSYLLYSLIALGLVTSSISALPDERAILGSEAWSGGGGAVVTPEPCAVIVYDEGYMCLASVHGCSLAEWLVLEQLSSEHAQLLNEHVCSRASM